MSLPYIDPDDDLYINLSLVIIIVKYLSVTKRGKLCINNDKLHIFLYLVKNPVILKQVLDLHNKQSIYLDDIESNCLGSISQNFDPLFDREALMALLTILLSNNFLTVTYKKKEGFFYVLTAEGKEKMQSMNSPHFKSIKDYCKKMTSIQGLAASKLNKTLKITMTRERQNEL